MSSERREDTELVEALAEGREGIAGLEEAIRQAQTAGFDGRVFIPSDTTDLEGALRSAREDLRWLESLAHLSPQQAAAGNTGAVPTQSQPRPAPTTTSGKRDYRQIYARSPEMFA